MNIPPSIELAEAQRMLKPDSRVVWLWHLKSAVWALILLALAMIAGSTFIAGTSLPWGIGIPLIGLVWVGLFVFMIWHNYAYYRSWGYRVDENHLRICHGVITRRTVDVPFSRVQHVDVEEGPIERNLGLARLILFTAGTSAARQEIAGLPRSNAEALRNQLLQHRQLLLPPDSHE